MEGNKVLRIMPNTYMHLINVGACVFFFSGKLRKVSLPASLSPFLLVFLRPTHIPRTSLLSQVLSWAAGMHG